MAVRTRPRPHSRPLVTGGVTAAGAGAALAHPLAPGWDNAVRRCARLALDFALDPAPGGRTRLLVRNRGRVEPAWLDLAYRAAIVPADHVMTRGMFRGLGQRVSA